MFPPFLSQLPAPLREAYQAAESILRHCETLQTVALFPRPQDAERFALAYVELGEMVSLDSDARSAIDRVDALLSRCGPVRFDGGLYRHAHQAVLEVAKRIVHQGAVDTEGTYHLDFKPTAADVPDMLERIVVPDLDELAVALQCEAAKAAALTTEQVQEQEQPTIWYHGEKSYSTDGQSPIVVSAEQHNVLKAFLDRNVALDTQGLQKAGASNVAVVFDKLLKNFGDSAIRRPSHKGEGYFIRVRFLAARTGTNN